MATHLWNRADISKLRGSSGHDYLICNSNLKTPVGSSVHCYRKEMFRIPQFFKIQEGTFNLIIITHLQCKTKLMLKQGSSSDIDQLACTQKKQLDQVQFQICRSLRAEQNILSIRTFVCFKNSIFNYYNSAAWTTPCFLW